MGRRSKVSEPSRCFWGNVHFRGAACLCSRGVCFLGAGSLSVAAFAPCLCRLVGVWVSGVPGLGVARSALVAGSVVASQRPTRPGRGLSLVFSRNVSTCMKCVNAQMRLGGGKRFSQWCPRHNRHHVQTRRTNHNLSDVGEHGRKRPRGKQHGVAHLRVAPCEIRQRRRYIHTR